MMNNDDNKKLVSLIIHNQFEIRQSLLSFSEINQKYNVAQHLIKYWPGVILWSHDIHDSILKLK